MERVAGTEWEMPVVLGGLYGMRRSEILGLRWRNVDLEQGTFDVVEQLPFHVPPHTLAGIGASLDRKAFHGSA